ncbi:serine hydrolase [uncultured Agrococcus sp.]|uniref:serine hydrolase domain-containing protein n=1 Tax=uncultured Agrococcus sp. TaxID=382258 RepID=UPI0025DD9807|nr:serine hydrolase domain-containing protein [uncultured Agrococcus sp.]
MQKPKVLAAAGAVAAVIGLTGSSLASVNPELPVPDDTELHQQLWSSPSLESLQDDRQGKPDDDRELENALEQIVDDGATGITARVEVGDRTWAGAAGTRGLESNAPVLERSPFRAASNTKMMISALVMQEVEAGTWTLDTPIAEAVPGIFPNHPDVTLRELLSHTAGAPNGTLELLLNEMDDPADIDEYVEVLGHRYPDAEHIGLANAGEWTEPGEFVYSNAGYIALGVALEAVTNQPVAELLEQRIFRPLGMHHTSVPDEPGMRGTAMQEAMWDGGDWHDLAHFDPTIFSHSGSVVSTTRDLSRFTEALLTGELFSQELVDEMAQPVTTDPMEYGLGIYRIADPCEPGDYLYGHDGLTFGTASIAYSSPDGERQISLGITGLDGTGDPEEPGDLSPVLEPMLAASCG